jgi:hypothetical protein
MKTETLKKIFTFLEENGEHNAPLMWKLQNNIPITEKDDLIVKGGLSLWDTDITSLPKGLEVRSNLVVAYSKLTSLPEGLKVGGDLRLDGLEINLLPKGLEVGDDLFINNTPLTKYKQNKLKEMIYPGFIKGQITIDR